MSTPRQKLADAIERGHRKATGKGIKHGKNALATFIYGTADKIEKVCALGMAYIDQIGIPSRSNYYPSLMYDEIRKSIGFGECEWQSVQSQIVKRNDEYDYSIKEIVRFLREDGGIYFYLKDKE